MYYLGRYLYGLKSDALDEIEVYKLYHLLVGEPGAVCQFWELSGTIDNAFKNTIKER